MKKQSRLFHVYMNSKDGEIQFISEDDQGSKVLYHGYDVVKLENILTESQNRLRFPRT